MAAHAVAIMLASAAVAVGTTVYAGMEQAKGQRESAAYNAQIAAVNEKLAENKAADALQQGSVAEAQSRAQTRQIVGRQIAGFGAQNVVESGSALDVLGDTYAIGNTDIQRIRYNAARQAWGFGMDAYNAKAGNDLNQFQSKVDQQGTILSTIGKAASQIGGAAQSGMFGGGGAGGTVTVGQWAPVGG